MPNENVVKTNPDPTKNVLDLVDAAIQRLDDLAKAESKRLDQLIDEKDKQYQQRFKDSQEAVIKAEVAAEKRFGEVNNFRNTWADQQRNLMPRSEAEVKFDSFNKQFELINSQLDKIAGRGMGLNQAMGWILFGIAILGFLISKFT